MDAQLLLLVLIVLGAHAHAVSSDGILFQRTGKQLLSSCIGSGCTNDAMAIPTNGGTPSPSTQAAKPHKSLEWASETGIWMPRSISSKTCTIELSTDQPDEFNLLDEPLILEYAFLCCYECAKRDECASWVFKSEAKECFLKNQYDPSRNTIPCADCISYDASSGMFTYEKPGRARKTISEDAHDWDWGTFGRGWWKKAISSDTCTFGVGKDQSDDYNLQGMPLYLDSPVLCCDACSQTNRCESWVWRATHGSCYLKNTYDEAQQTDCSDCVANAEDGSWSLVPIKTSKADYEKSLEHKTTEWASETGVWMPESIAVKTCAVSEGFDQPDEFNLLDEPLVLEYAFLCCYECAKRDECASWVFKSRAEECFLKDRYDPSRNTIRCSECVSYDASSPAYRYEKPGRARKSISKDADDWDRGTFGRGWWRESTSSDTCTFSVGKDQSSDYSLQGMPLYLDSAVLCCDACSQTNRCESWVWRATHGSCYLKNTYDEAQQTDCSDCVAYAKDGEWSLLPIKTSKPGLTSSW